MRADVAPNPRITGLPPVTRRNAGLSPSEALGSGWAFGLGPDIAPATGTRPGGLALPAPHPVAGWALARWPHVLPPPPRGEALTPPHILAAPTLSALGATTPEGALAAFQRTYLSCVERTRGLTPPGRRTERIAADKRPALLAACEALRVVDVAPAAWVRTRVAAWQRAAEGRAYAAGKRGAAVPAVGALPSFAWVLAAAAVGRYTTPGALPAAGQDGDAGRLMVPIMAVALTPPLLALMGAWQAARVALLALPPGSPYEAAEATVASHLGAWADRCDKVRREHAAQGDALRYLAAQGEWVWAPPAVASGGVTLADLPGVLAAAGRARLAGAVRAATSPTGGAAGLPPPRGRTATSGAPHGPSAGLVLPPVPRLSR